MPTLETRLPYCLEQEACALRIPCQRLLCLLEHLKMCFQTRMVRKTIPTLLVFGAPFSLKRFQLPPYTFQILACLAQFFFKSFAPLTRLCILLPRLARSGLCRFDGPVRLFKPRLQTIQTGR